MRPSIGSVQAFRYWAAVASRVAGVLLLLWWLPTVIERCAAYLPGGIQYVLTDSAWWTAATAIGLAAGLLLGAGRLARLLAPMPRPECPGCGYATAPDSDRCPECGLNLARAAGTAPGR